MRIKSISLLLIGLLWSMGTFAQSLRDQIGQFDVAGYPGNSFPVVLTFPTGVPASLSVVTKYAGTATPLPANRQPTVTRTGNTATITFMFPVAAFEWSGYHEITWSGRTQIAGDITAKLSNRTRSAVITTMLVKSADATQIAISLIGGSGGGSVVTAADIASVGNALYRKIGDPISFLTLTDRPQIPVFPTWIPTQDPGFQTLAQVNALIGTGLTSVQQSLSTMGTDIASRVPFSTYTANRSTDQNATTAAQSTANNALAGAQAAQASITDIRSTYVPNARRIRFNGGAWQTFGADLDITVSAGQAGVNSLNGRNGNLTGFVETADLTPYNTRITNVENGKVNNVVGMGLSANDFTNALLAKLNSIQAGATNVTDNSQLLNGANYAKSADVNSWTAAFAPTKQDKLGIGSNITVGTAFFGSLSVGSTSAGVLTLAGKRLTKSDGLPFQFEDNVAVTGSLSATRAVLTGDVTAGAFFVPGVDAAETAMNRIVRGPNGGLELVGNTRIMTWGIGSGGNFDVRPDGNLLQSSNGNSNRSVFWHPEGISVNRGTNTARRPFDVGTDTYIDGDLRASSFTLNGNRITDWPTPGVAGVPSFVSPASFATATADEVDYDKNRWKRFPGTVQTDPVEQNNRYTATQYNGSGSFHYERQFDGPVYFRWWKNASADNHNRLRAMVNSGYTQMRVDSGKYYFDSYAWTPGNFEIIGDLADPRKVQFILRGANALDNSPNTRIFRGWFFFDGVTPGQSFENITIKGITFINECTATIANTPTNATGSNAAIHFDGANIRNVVIERNEYVQRSKTAPTNFIYMKVGANKLMDKIRIENNRTDNPDSTRARMFAELINQDHPNNDKTAGRGIHIVNNFIRGVYYGSSVAGNFINTLVERNLYENCRDYGNEFAGSNMNATFTNNRFGGTQNVLFVSNYHGENGVSGGDYPIAANSGQHYTNNRTLGYVPGIVEIRGGGDLVFNENQLNISGGIYLRANSLGGVVSAEIKNNKITSNAIATNMSNKALIYLEGATNVRASNNTLIRTSTDTQPLVQAVSSDARDGATGTNSTGSQFLFNTLISAGTPSTYFSATAPNSLSQGYNFNGTGALINN